MLAVSGCGEGREQGGSHGPPLLRRLQLFSGCIGRHTCVYVGFGAEWGRTAWVQWWGGKGCGGDCAGFPSSSCRAHYAFAYQCTMAYTVTAYNCVQNK